MTLELQKPVFSSSTARNSSFDIIGDYENGANVDFDFQEVIAKVRERKPQNSVLSPSEKKSFDSGFSERGKQNMADRYSDDYDSYDEDFEDESSSPRREHERSSRFGRYSRFSTENETQDISPKRIIKLRSRKTSIESYKSTYGRRLGSITKVKPKKLRSSASSREHGSKSVGKSSLVQRVLSANRHKVSKLHNIVEDLEREVSDLKGENKTLMRIQHQQEKEIKRIDVEEGSLPLILERHSAEVRNLRERLKRTQEVLTKKEREAKDQDDAIFKLRDNLKRYKELAANKNLGERDSLARKLDGLELSLAERDRRILELEKTITLKEKIREREVRENRDRYKQAKNELKRLQDDFQVLREKLQEKEKELEVKNIYHQHIVTKKKQAALALPAGTKPMIEDKSKSLGDQNNFTEENKTDEKTEKPKNIFLTNASDSSSVVTNELSETVGDAKMELSGSFGNEPTGTGVINANNVVLENDELDKLKKEREETERRLREEQKRKEKEKLREEERRRRNEEEEKERVRQLEEERKRNERKEQLLKQKEEERLQKVKEEMEAERKRQQEEEELRKKKEQLLARMKAIDDANKVKSKEIVDTGLLERVNENKSKNLSMKAIDDENKVKSKEIIDAGILDRVNENKPKKLPIFLQSDSNKDKENVKEPRKKDHIFGSSGNLKKVSAGSSGRSSKNYEFKQSYENLHQGLPAHPAEGHFRNKGTFSDSSKRSEDDLTFGSYKNFVGNLPRRRVERRNSHDNIEASSNGYKPSFGDQKDTDRIGSGLDFSSKRNNALAATDETVSFGGYNPSFGSAANKNVSTFTDVDSPGNTRSGRNRRLRDTNKTSVFGADILSGTDSKPTNKENPLFGDDLFSSPGSQDINKNKNYPWENKIDIGNKVEGDSFENSLLPRRKRLQIAPQTEKRALSNALIDTVDDEIEEVIL